MISGLLIIHNHDRMSSITRVHTTTWSYFSSRLPESFSRSPKVVKEGIITDIDDLVEEFRRTSSDVGASLFAMYRLLGILQDILEVCFDMISIFAIDWEDLTEACKTQFPLFHTVGRRNQSQIQDAAW